MLRRSLNVIISLFIFFLALNTFAENTAKFKLQELARGSNALLVEMDKILAHKKSACNLDAASLSQASQNLKALIDQRSQELISQSEQVISLMKTCKKDCTCETYEYALEKITSSEKYSTTVKYSAKERILCVKKNNSNFCQSKLFKAIK